ncbi:hypothetical protein SCLCIDRAFT_871889 [Scleroderma citrinum Foug A]|uniref:Uncharacterized protein n=1 Tax=Scleroderma citrinum Foug A TaxID=1036808 RepID=A0A0C3A9B4_9AGAM|nr:hypothetical protein SCLCIDRAFT_871889 [Scleroderma citrinum Foug A]
MFAGMTDFSHMLDPIHGSGDLGRVGERGTALSFLPNPHFAILHSTLNGLEMSTCSCPLLCIFILVARGAKKKARDVLCNRNHGINLEHKLGLRARWLSFLASSMSLPRDEDPYCLQVRIWQRYSHSTTEFSNHNHKVHPHRYDASYLSWYISTLCRDTRGQR